MDVKISPMIYGQILYSYLKKGFMFGIDYELANLIPYKTFRDPNIEVLEKAQILLLKFFNLIV